MSRTQLSIKCLLSSILMLCSLTSMAQGEPDGSDMGADPGLPEAPIPPPRSMQGPLAPAPAQESQVQPYESTAPAPVPAPAPTPKAASPSKRPAVITGKLAELNLTPEQAQQIIEIRRQWRPETEKRMREEFNFLKQNLTQAMADNSPAEEVRRRFEGMQKKYLELQSTKFEKLLRIREVLTPEQRKKFAELRAKPGRSTSINDND